MAVQSKILDLLPPDYGYVILVGAGSVFVNIWMALNVVRARAKYGVEVSFLLLYSFKFAYNLQLHHVQCMYSFILFIFFIYIIVVLMYFLFIYFLNCFFIIIFTYLHFIYYVGPMLIMIF